MLLILVLSSAVAQASSVSVPLPGAAGSLPKTVSFNAGTSFKHIDEVRLRCSGSITYGLGYGDGVERPVYPYFEWPAEVEAYMDPPGIGIWVAVFGSSEGPFNEEKIFNDIIPTTWDFLLDGQAESTINVYGFIVIGGIMLIPPSATVSQATLTIKGTVIDILSPSTGEPLTGGSIYTISWQDYRSQSSCPFNYFLDYSIDGGQNWVAINSDAVSGSCSYDWIVPDINSLQCKIRITDANDPNFTDTTAGYFTIHKCPTDLNGDAFVDFVDYAILSLNWQQSPDPCDPNSGDIIKNGIVDIYDLAELCADWLACYVTQAAAPEPADHAIGTSRYPTLRWSPGKNSISHDVYFGTDFNAVDTADTTSSGVYMGNQDVNYWDSNNYANELDANTTYYWRIDEAAGCTAKGDVWSFTTAPLPPGQADNPTPVNGATNVAVTTDLSWTAGSGATSHDVYFGTTNPPAFRVNQTGTTYDTGTMDTNTTYYWRIDEKNTGGTTTGDVWSFATIFQLPGQAGNPNPANGASNVGRATDLSWTAGSLAKSHDVYFGTTNPPAFRVNQTGTTYDTGTMDINTTYYWQIDEKNGSGTTAGILWSFTTGDLDTSLVGWWKFDEANGTTAYDSAGSNNGTIYGGATWTTGHINGALSFNGSNNYVNCGSGPSNYDNITVSAWMKTTTHGPLVSNRYTAGSYGTWYTLFSDVIEIGDNTNGGYKSLTFNTTTLDGAWHHIVYTKNGTSHVIYVDGSLDQQFTSNADISWSRPLYIGKRLSAWFNGVIDDVRIYNRALTANDVALLYQQGQ